MVVIKGPHRSDGILEGVCQKCTRLRHFQIKELQNCVGKGLAKLALSPNLTILAHQPTSAAKSWLLLCMRSLNRMFWVGLTGGIRRWGSLRLATALPAKLDSCLTVQFI